MINRSLYFPIVLLLFSFLNCPGTKDPESENLFYGVILAETARLNTPYTGSCDVIADSSLCMNFVKGYTLGDTSCDGTLSNSCPEENRIGVCQINENSEQSFEGVYYSVGGRIWGLEEAGNHCYARSGTFVPELVIP